jgi:hypothetical protein
MKLPFSSLLASLQLCQVEQDSPGVDLRDLRQEEALYPLCRFLSLSPPSCSALLLQTLLGRMSVACLDSWVMFIYCNLFSI